MDRTSQAEETVRRYSDMVYRLAFARTGNTADAEDVYQEVFLRYLRSDLMLEQMGIRFESSHHEQGPGQNEIDFRYNGALAAADGAPQ